MKLQKIQNVKYFNKIGYDFLQFDISSPSKKIDYFPRIRRFQDHKLMYAVFFDNSGWGIVNGKFNQTFPEIVSQFKKMFFYAHTYQ